MGRSAASGSPGQDGRQQAIARETGRPLGVLPERGVASVETIGELQMGVLAAADPDAHARRGDTDYLHWQKVDRQILKRVNKLIDDTLRKPAGGAGKPGALAHALAGYWSRRITDEYRLIYAFDDHSVTIIAARFHYGGR